MTDELEVRVRNLDCEHDARAIERGLEGLPGLVRVRVFPRSAKAVLTYAPDITSPDVLRQRLRAIGFPPEGSSRPSGPPRPWRNPKVLTSAGSGLLLFAGWLAGLIGLPGGASIALYVAAIVTGGWLFGRELRYRFNSSWLIAAGAAAGLLAGRLA